jgi:phytoene synthase
MSAPTTPDDPCQALTRERDFDAYVASLFAPAEKRPALYALHAFALEIASVRDRVSEPLPGEVRLQWWRDALEGQARGDAAAHPIAARLLATIERYRLPTKPFLDLLEARTFDLYDDPMPSTADFEGYAGEAFAAPLRLASLVLADGGDPGPADAAGHAGVALAVAAALRDLPRHRARGQVFIPGDLLARHGVTREAFLADLPPPVIADFTALGRRHLAAFEALIGRVSASIAPAFLPAAAAALQFRAGSSTVATWRRIFAIWRLSRRF